MNEPLNLSVRKEMIEDGIYVAKAGKLRKLEPIAGDLKSVKINAELYKAAKELQKKMRKQNGKKPDLHLIIDALLMEALKDNLIEYAVQVHCSRTAGL